MWYNNLHPILNEQDYLERKLVKENGCIGLDDIYSGIVWKTKHNGIKSENIDFSTIREQTLTYLHTLLTEGQVTAGRIIRLKPGEAIPDPETVKNDPLFEDIPGTPDEIIEYIRKEWNTNPDFSESFDCVIKLPNNPWPT